MLLDVPLIVYIHVRDRSERTSARSCKLLSQLEVTPIPLISFKIVVLYFIDYNIIIYQNN